MSLRRHLDKDMTDAERRIANLVVMGRVAELDATRARVKVTAGDITTDWLPFAANRAGQVVARPGTRRAGGGSMPVR